MTRQVNISITPYSDEYVKSHEEFSLKLWPAKKRRRSEKYNRWKFRGPEKGSVDGLLLAIDGGKILGQLGLIPVQLKNGSRTFEAQWACDLVVDPEYREHGIGRKLFEYGMNREKVTLGNNPSPKADVLMIKAGFRPFRSGRLNFFPLDPMQVVGWAVPKKFSFVRTPISKIVKPYFDLKRRKAISKTGSFEECSWREVSELIRQRQSSDTNPQILHDKQFLKWRAAGLPEYSSEISAMKSSGGSYALFSLFPPYFNIYEWFCTGEKEFESMISALMVIAASQEAKTIQSVANNDTEQEWLSKTGFIKSRNIERIIFYSKDTSLESSDNFYFTLYDTDLNL